MTGPKLFDLRLSFLVFRSRSGSTFFGDRLSRHPDVLVTPESKLSPRLISFFANRRTDRSDIDDLIDYIYFEQKFLDWRLPKENLYVELCKHKNLSWDNTFLACCTAYRNWIKPSAQIVVFKKSGWYYKNCDTLLAKFPNSVIIWMLRDPRGVYNSACRAIHSKKNIPMANNIIKNAFGWRDYVTRLLKSESEWPDRNYKIYYEELLYNMPFVLSTIWNQLKVPSLSENKMNEILSDQNDASHLITRSTVHLHGNVTQMPIIERASQWREELPKWRAELIWLICRRQMQQVGYTK